MDVSNEQSYALTSSFIQALRDGDAHLLQTAFGISPAVLEEMLECLGEFDIALSSVDIAPAATAFTDYRFSHPLMEVFAFEQPHCYGVDCILFADGRATEAMLHGEIQVGPEGLRWRYRYIGS